ncbi:MAG: hypothetical protein ABJH63_07710 [Rhizobiaceae bacterium]
MPNMFDAIQQPSVDCSNWDAIEDIFCLIRDEFTGFHFEGREEAVQESNRPHSDQDYERYFDPRLVRFRKTNDKDALDYYYGQGLESLKECEALIPQREASPRFIFHWGRLAACHGFILSAALATGSDTWHERAGYRSLLTNNLQSHQQWFSHYYLRERPKCKNREEAEERIERLVNAITDGDFSQVSLQHQLWCERLLSLFPKLKSEGGRQISNFRHGKLTKSFRKKVLTEKRMTELIKLPTDGLPPLDLNIPPPKGG